MSTSNKEKALSWARISLAVILVSSAVLGVVAYKHYQFDKEYVSHMEMAESAGSPEELVQRLEEAQDGLDELGYSGGQYAWFWKTDRTNTVEQRELLRSHIERAKHIRDSGGVAEGVSFMDYRERLEENQPYIMLYSHWYHSLPPGLNIVFFPMTLIFMSVALMVFGLVFFESVKKVHGYSGRVVRPLLFNYES
jgi:hypothetical protein